MYLNLNIASGFLLIKLFHTFISITFIITAIALIIRSFRGVYKRKEYSKTDKLLSIGFIILLFLQLIFGFILFSNIDSGMGYNYLGAGASAKIVSKRLWPIEHIVLMLFALLIANLGLIISINTKTDRSKHLNTLIYYSISLALIFFSLFVNFVL